MQHHAADAVLLMSGTLEADVWMLELFVTTVATSGCSCHQYALCAHEEHLKQRLAMPSQHRHALCQGQVSWLRRRGQSSVLRGLEALSNHADLSRNTWHEHGIFEAGKNPSQEAFQNMQ